MLKNEVSTTIYTERNIMAVGLGERKNSELKKNVQILKSQSIKCRNQILSYHIKNICIFSFLVNNKQLA